MGDVSDKKFQQQVLARLEAIGAELKRLSAWAAAIDAEHNGGGPNVPVPTAPQWPEIDPPADIVYHNGVSQPDARSVVRLQQFDSDTALRAQVRAFRARFGQDVFGPTFAIARDELLAAWPDASINPALDLNTSTAGTQLDGYSRHYEIDGEVQPGVTRFRKDEEGDSGRAAVFQEFKERLARDLATTPYSGSNETGTAAIPGG